MWHVVYGVWRMVYGVSCMANREFNSLVWILRRQREMSLTRFGRVTPGVVGSSNQAIPEKQLATRRSMTATGPRRICFSRSRSIALGGSGQCNVRTREASARVIEPLCICISAFPSFMANQPQPSGEWGRTRTTRWTGLFIPFSHMDMEAVVVVSIRCFMQFS